MQIYSHGKYTNLLNVQIARKEKKYKFKFVYHWPKNSGGEGEFYRELNFGCSFIKPPPTPAHPLLNRIQ